MKYIMYYLDTCLDISRYFLIADYYSERNSVNIVLFIVPSRLLIF